MVKPKKKSPQLTTTLRVAVGVGFGVVGFFKTDHKPTTWQKNRPQRNFFVMCITNTRRLNNIY